MLAGSGQAWVAGEGDAGQLGLGPLVLHAPAPQPLHLPAPVTSAAAGMRHTLFLLQMTQGLLMAAAAADAVERVANHHQLQHQHQHHHQGVEGDELQQSMFNLDMEGHSTVSLAASMRAVGLVVYGCGSNRRQQLGKKLPASVPQPQHAGVASGQGTSSDPHARPGIRGFRSGAPSACSTAWVPCALELPGIQLGSSTDAISSSMDAISSSSTPQAACSQLPGPKAGAVLSLNMTHGDCKGAGGRNTAAAQVLAGADHSGLLYNGHLLLWGRAFPCSSSHTTTAATSSVQLVTPVVAAAGYKLGPMLGMTQHQEAVLHAKLSVAYRAQRLESSAADGGSSSGLHEGFHRTHQAAAEEAGCVHAKHAGQVDCDTPRELQHPHACGHAGAPAACKWVQVSQWAGPN